MYDRHRTDATRVWFIAKAAADLGATALPLVLRALQDHGAGVDLASLGVWAVGRADAKSDLVESLADILLNGPAWRSAGHVDPVLQQLELGLDDVNAARRLRLLCWKLCAVTENEGSRLWFKHQRAGSISEWEDDDPNDRFGALLKALVTALQRSAEWLTIDQTLEVVDGLPNEVRVRVRAWLLASAPGIGLTVLIDELSRAMAERAPTGDDLPLLDRIVAVADPAQYEQRWAEALGDAPSVVEVAQALAGHKLSPTVRRGVQWAGIVPEKVGAAWSQAASVVAAAYGRSSRASLEKRSRVEGGLGHSPITAEELASVSPVEAARMVAAWRPDSSQPLASARELARTLDEVVKAAPHVWLEEPLRVTTVLRHPTYINH